MTSSTIGHIDVASDLHHKLWSVILILVSCCLSPLSVSAQQVESVALCDEAGIPPIGEPVPMIYGDSTDGCLIDPATDIDRFSFAGSTGEIIRINLLGQTNGLDPRAEVRDPMGSIILTVQCAAAFNAICSAEGDATLPSGGNYQITVSDIGTDNIGNYTMQLERIFPGPNIERLNYDSTTVTDGRISEVIDNTSVDDGISPQTDVDHFYFHGVAGTNIRFSVLGRTNGFDPRIEVLDDTGAIVLDGELEGAACAAAFNTICSFSVDFTPATTGTYTVLVNDWGNDTGGNYYLGLWCIFGACDNDGDGNADIGLEFLRYGESITVNDISPAVDGEFFKFKGSPGDLIQINVLGQTNGFDPRIEVRGPSGTVVLDGENDSAACAAAFNTTCSFTTPEVGPTNDGMYTMVLHDWGTDTPGDFDVTLSCNFSPGGDCENLPGSFPSDVPEDFWAFSFIEILAEAGITSGCDVDSYCPSDPVTRAQMAVFIERGINDGNYRPQACQGTVFSDVPSNYWACDYIEQFFADGVTSGCAPGMYCPENPVTRAQMAVFLLRAKYGAAYQPPPASGIVFEDVDISYWAAPWIEQLATEGITAGCSAAPALYCPEDSVTRDQMAVFIVRTFALDRWVGN